MHSGLRGPAYKAPCISNPRVHPGYTLVPKLILTCAIEVENRVNGLPYPLHKMFKLLKDLQVVSTDYVVQ